MSVLEEVTTYRYTEDGSPHSWTFTTGDKSRPIQSVAGESFVRLRCYDKGLSVVVWAGIDHALCDTKAKCPSLHGSIGLQALIEQRNKKCKGLEVSDESTPPLSIDTRVKRTRAQLRSEKKQQDNDSELAIDDAVVTIELPVIGELADEPSTRDLVVLKGIRGCLSIKLANDDIRDVIAYIRREGFDESSPQPRAYNKRSMEFKSQPKRQQYPKAYRADERDDDESSGGDTNGHGWD